MADKPVYSMTGYGKGDVTLYNRRFTAEIKSVNHRYNEIGIRLPRVLNQFEDDVRKLAAGVISRGKTDIHISFESLSEDDASVKLNRPLLKAYLNALNEIKAEAGCADEPMLAVLSRLPDIFTTEKTQDTEETAEQMKEALIKSVNEALSRILAMREREGAVLKTDILQKLDYIDEHAKAVAILAPTVAEDYKQRLKEKIETALNDTNYDEQRLLTEVTIFADKSCIDEEITRLFSHISQTRGVLTTGGAIGRKLDFLSQELNREINTISSKSNNTEITKHCIEMKSELEKIREQVQNIE